VVLILGGARFATLEVEIYQQATQMLRLDVAASLAVIQMAITLLVGWASAWLEAQSGASLEVRPGSDVQRKPTTLAARALLFGSLTFIALVLLAPMITLIVRSFDWESGSPWRYYAALGQNIRGALFFVPPQVAIGNSLFFALVTMALTLLLGLPLAYALAYLKRRRWLEAILILPLGTSAATLGLGFLVTFDQPPLDLRRSFVLLPVAHTLVALPFFVRAALPAFRALDQRLREAARGLGAGPLQVMRYIDLPLLAPPIAAAAVFAFAVSLGEFGASLLIARPEYPTMPVVIYRFLSQPGALNYGQAMAMSSLLMLVTASSAALIEWIRAR